MSRSQKQYLLDIVEAIDDARRFAEDVTFEELEGDLRTQYALQRAFEIIGEATKQVDGAFIGYTNRFDALRALLAGS